jgi:NADH-quinone oxidoreductase subunit A
MNDPFWQFTIYGTLVLIVVGGMLLLPALLGERHHRKASRRQDSATATPYESGIRPTGSGHLRLPIQYYLLAMLFVLFDMEAVYLYAWALVAREAGWLGFIEAFVFIMLLAVGLFYLWRVGALDWTSVVGRGGPRRTVRPVASDKDRDRALVA